MHEIRFCKKDEYKLLQEFIKKYWKEDHVFVKSKEVLDFQHFDKKNQRYNFLVAFNKQNKEFDAVLGFILQSQYDTNAKDINIWTSLWSAKKEFPSLGLRLYKSLQELFSLKNTASSGMSEFSLKFVRLFNYHKIGKLYHFYIKNDKRKYFKIAYFKDIKTISHRKSSLKLKLLSCDEFKNYELKSNFYPKKSKDYFIYRYFKHPIYKYKAYGVFKDDKILSIFFTRIIKQNKSKCMLIVDFLGKFQKNLYDEFQKLLQKQNLEFVSFLCYVWDINKIIQMGFSLKNEESIIPVYFEPFLKENIDIYFAFKSEYKNYTIFKGDSDQDRPNIYINSV